jgi:hypothetical protein
METAVAIAPAKNKGGRPPGRLNKQTEEVKAWAMGLVPIAKKRLAELIQSEDEKVAAVAIREVLNRAYGLPSQTLSMDQTTLQVFAGIKIVIGSEDTTKGEGK